MERVSLDTNILVYALDPGAGDKHRTARHLLRRAALGDGVLTQQVIGEFLNVGRRTAHVDQPRLRRIALGLCSTFPILPTTRDLLFEAFDRAGRFQLQFWDSVIASACLAGSVGWLISEDLQDGMVLDGLRILNPFVPANAPLLEERLGPLGARS